MALDFEDQSACVDWLVAKTGQDPEDFEQWLEMTADKKNPNKPVYRVYFVGALTLAAMLQEDRLLKAEDGVSFGNDPMATVRGWLAKQAVTDKLMGLTVPPSAEPVLANLGLVTEPTPLRRAQIQVI